MANSTQTAVSDGTLVLLEIGFDYLDRSEITVYFDSILTTAWSWVGTTEKKIAFSPAVSTGVTVLVKRTTESAALRHVYATGAAFTASTLDESLSQVLHIVQEAQESNLSSEFFQNVNMHSNKIVGLQDGVADYDAVNVRQVIGLVSPYTVAAAASASAAAESAGSASASATSAAASAASASTLLANAILKDGSRAMTAALTLAGNAASALHAVPKQQLDSTVATAIAAEQFGRLVKVTVYKIADTGSIFTADPRTKTVVVEACGAGGGGGGSTTTAGSQVSLAGPGGSGAYGKAKFTSNFSGVTLTIGAAGTGGAAGGSAGGTGGTTSFGALLSCPGGGGGGGGGAAGNGTSFINITLAAAAAPTGANLVGFGGQTGIQSQFSTLGTHFSGQGGSNPLGSGGCAFAANITAAGTGYGSGGSGHIIGSSTAGIAGGAGAPGVIIVYEYA